MHDIRRLRLLWLLLVAVIAGCGQDREFAKGAVPQAEVKENTSSQAKSKSDGFPRTITDGLSRQVVLAHRPKRIVSLAPKNTEELFAIGAGSQVVGVTSYCNFPIEAKQREQIGGFSSKSISLEKVIALHPDLVVSAGDIHAPLIAELERLQIPVCALAAETVDELYEEMNSLGRLVDHESEADQIVQQMKDRVDSVKTVVEKIPAKDRVDVFYMTWDDPLTAAGPKSYAGQMLEICGGVNVISDVASRYPQISEEALLDRDPDVIIAATMTSMRWTADSLRARPGWEKLQAIQKERLYLLDGDSVSRCGPRMVEVLEAMAHAIYPEYFAKPSHANQSHDDSLGEKSP